METKERMWNDPWGAQFPMMTVSRTPTVLVCMASALRVSPERHCGERHEETTHFGVTQVPVMQPHILPPSLPLARGPGCGTTTVCSAEALSAEPFRARHRDVTVPFGSGEPER